MKREVYESQKAFAGEKKPLCRSRLHGAHDVYGDDGDRGPTSALRAGGRP